MSEKIKVNKTAKSSSFESTSAFNRKSSDTSTVKDIKTILTANKATLEKLEKTVESINSSLKDSNLFKTNKSTTNDEGAVSKAKEKEKNNIFGKSLKESFSGLGKSLKDLFFGNKEKEGKKENSFLSKILSTLGVLLTGALSLLPLLFTNTLNKAFAKILTSLGVSEGTAGTIAEYLTPAVQGAAIGYGITRSAKGLIAGAVVGLTNHAINSLSDKVKGWLGVENDDESNLSSAVDVGIDMLKGAIVGAVIGFKYGSWKGAAIGAAVGAVGAGVISMGSRLVKMISNPREMSPSEIAANAGWGALGGTIVGIIAGAAIGGKFGIYGLIAGAVVGGLAGLIGSLISNAKAKHQKINEEHDKYLSKVQHNKAGLMTDKDEIAERDRQIKELKEKANDKDKYNSTEREKFKLEYKALENQKRFEEIQGNFQRSNTFAYNTFSRYGLDTGLEGVTYVKDDEGNIRLLDKDAKKANLIKRLRNSDKYKNLTDQQILREIEGLEGLKDYLDDANMSSTWSAGAGDHSEQRKTFGHGGDMLSKDIQEKLKYVTEHPELSSVIPQSNIKKDKKPSINVESAEKLAADSTTSIKNLTDSINNLTDKLNNGGASNSPGTSTQSGGNVSPGNRV